MYFFLRLAIFSISPTSILTRDTTGNGSRNDCHRLLHLEAENVPEVGRQGDVLEADAAAEERCDLADAVTVIGVSMICICLIFTYKGTKNISLLQLFAHFSYVELTLSISTCGVRT